MIQHAAGAIELEGMGQAVRDTLRLEPARGGGGNLR